MLEAPLFSDGQVLGGPDLVLPGERSELLSPTGYVAMQELCERLQSVGGINSMLGLPVLVDKTVDWEKAELLLSSEGPENLHKLYIGILKSHVNSSYVLLQVYTYFLPRGAGAALWVHQIREQLLLWESAHPRFKASLSGGATFAVDALQAVMDGMCRYLAASVGLIMAVVSCIFRSVVLPLRLALALAFTLSVAFSAAVLVYQTSMFHWLFPWLANYDGLTYEVVPLAACVAVALGLDYDIFLVSRILEFRLSGLSDKDSIIAGVAATSGVISGAGTIMALAFSGLFFSKKLIHQQFALLLVTSVLLDTFVVRTVLVPALMMVAEHCNWWPRRMPLVSVEALRSSERRPMD